jgi:hypothetical protein
MLPRAYLPYPRLSRCADPERSMNRRPVYFQARGNLFDRYLRIGEQFPRVADLLRCRCS